MVLIARRDGIHCSDPACNYRQNWALDYMADRPMDAGSPGLDGGNIVTNTQILRDAIPRAEALHLGIRELKNRLGSVAGAAPWDAEAAVSELVRRLRFILREWEELEAPDDEPDCLDEGARSGSYRAVGMSDACVTLRMPDGTAVEGVGQTLGEADADARQRASGCCAALLAGVGIKPYDLVLPPPPPPWDGPRASAGCYAASWGWVHVRPACRCPR